eukprot:767597-Hanusia_phi.AAC.14
MHSRSPAHLLRLRSGRGSSQAEWRRRLQLELRPAEGEDWNLPGCFRRQIRANDVDSRLVCTQVQPLDCGVGKDLDSGEFEGIVQTTNGNLIHCWARPQSFHRAGRAATVIGQGVTVVTLLIPLLDAIATDRCRSAGRHEDILSTGPNNRRLR